MQAKKAFVCGLLIAMGLCWGGRELSTQIRTLNNSRFYTLPDGVVVQSIRPEPSEIAETLQIKRWHFRVTLPPGSDKDCFTHGVQLRKRGEAAPPGEVGGIVVVPNGRTIDVTVCLYPQNGDWATAENFCVWDSDNFPVSREGGTSGSEKYPNPFRGRVNEGAETILEASPAKDGSLILMMARKTPIRPLNGVYYTQEDNEGEVSIVYRFSAMNHKKFSGENATPIPEKTTRPFWEAWFR